MEKALVTNAAEESQVKAAARKEKSDRDVYLDDLRFLMTIGQGRRFLKHIIEFTGMFRSSFTGNSETYFLEGQRNFGIKLSDDLASADPDAFGQLFIETMKGKKEI